MALQRIVEYFRSLFAVRTESPCAGCVALREYNEGLREQINDLRDERAYLRDALFKVVRIPVGELATDSLAQRVHHEPIRTGPGKPWGRIQRELEAKHRRKPEDQTKDYWDKKNAELEAEAGLKGYSVNGKPLKVGATDRGLLDIDEIDIESRV